MRKHKGKLRRKGRLHIGPYGGAYRISHGRKVYVK